jgi:hypothetical protein
MADFAEAFFAQYSQFADNDFYFASESYGGHYLPITSLTLAQRESLPNFRGFLVGNPLTSMPYRNYGQWGTLWGHQQIPAPLWASYLDADCATKDSAACTKIENQMEKITRALNPYALDFPVCPPGGDAASASSGRHQEWTMRGIIKKANDQRAKAFGLQSESPDWSYWPEDYEPCSDEYAADWLNLPEVQKALHAVPTHWNECNNTVSNRYSMDDINAPVMDVYKQLFSMKDAQGSPYKIMIYSGDDDTVCATMGTQQFIWDSDFATVDEEWTSWQVRMRVCVCVCVYQMFFHTQSLTLSLSLSHTHSHSPPDEQPDVWLRDKVQGADVRHHPRSWTHGPEHGMCMCMLSAYMCERLCECEIIHIHAYIYTYT